MEYDRDASDTYLIEIGYYSPVPENQVYLKQCLQIHTQKNRKRVYYSSDHEKHILKCSDCNLLWLDVSLDDPRGGNESWISPLEIDEFELLDLWATDLRTYDHKLWEFNPRSNLKFVYVQKDVYLIKN